LETVAKVFAVKGYYNANVRDILDEAGISTGSFYFYFNNNYADRIGGVKSKF